ncbi:hypothetical protein C2G38_2090464 [Gigaspora rosea]|uniref:Uncharacterized protein n=1 Tax=Gigaspora rosea TaxID=44941 RepID=A0A397V4Q1_9GLOM|nr:hypothetical protein C2G38_2090464 [Gigaspora rosea]
MSHEAKTVFMSLCCTSCYFLDTIQYVAFFYLTKTRLQTCNLRANSSVRFTGLATIIIFAHIYDSS